MKFLVALVAALVPVAAAADAVADQGPDAPGTITVTASVGITPAQRRVPTQLTPAQRVSYRAIFLAIDAGRFAAAESALAGLPDGPLHATAKAQLILARGPGRSGIAADWLAANTDLPQAPRLVALAARAVDTPALPIQHTLRSVSFTPAMGPHSARAGGARDAEVIARLNPLLAADRNAEAEAIVTDAAPTLSADVAAEWLQRVAWSSYGAGDDFAAERLGRAGSGGEQHMVGARRLDRGAGGLPARRLRGGGECIRCGRAALRVRGHRPGGQFLGSARRARLRPAGRGDEAPAGGGGAPRHLLRDARAAHARSRPAARLGGARLHHRRLEPPVGVARGEARRGFGRDRRDRSRRPRAQVPRRDRRRRQLPGAAAAGGAAQPAGDAVLARPPPARGHRPADERALSRARVESGPRLARRQGAGLCPCAPGKRLRHLGDEPDGCQGHHAADARRGEARAGADGRRLGRRCRRPRPRAIPSSTSTAARATSKSSAT